MDDKKADTLDGKVKFYTDANREVAILCNHQRTVAKNFADQMKKMEDRLKEKLQHQLILTEHLAMLTGGKKVKKEKAAELERLKSEVDIKLPPTTDQTEKALERLQRTISSMQNKLQSKVSYECVNW